MQIRSDLSPEVYSDAVHLLLASLDKKPSRRLTVGLTSIHNGEGVTYTTTQIAGALKRVSVKGIEHLELASLAFASRPALPTTDEVLQSSPDLDTAELDASRADQIKKGIAHHSSQVDVLLIDCPALQESQDALSIANVVDGYILVLQAGRNTRSEIANAERRLLASGGRLFGFILNRTG